LLLSLISKKEKEGSEPPRIDTGTVSREYNDMHLKRWLTGIIALPILIYLIGPGPRWLFYLFLYSISIAGLVEFQGITSPDQPKFARWSSFILVFLLFFSIFMRQVLLALAAILLLAYVPMTLFMLTHRSPDAKWTSQIGYSVLGPIYVALPLSMLVMIDIFPGGKMWIFFLLAVAFANDTGAFYFGRLFGRHRLYPSISPNKTWEGAVGGLLISLIVSLFFLRATVFQPVGPSILILVLCLVVAGQVGDLVESMLKRNHNTKDSGVILPGHGGILDRIDGILFSIPVLYLYLSFYLVSPWGIG